jgi:hypothetical protein
MKTIIQFVLTFTTGSILATSIAGKANADFALFSEAAFGYYNSSDSFVSQLDSNSSQGDAVSITGAAYDESYQFNANASASSVFKRLRAQGGGFVDSVSDGEGFFVDSTPEFYYSSGTASYRETLQYGGTATNYNSKYILKFTGRITGNAFAVITLQHAMNSAQTWIFDTPGSYDLTLVSNAFVHGFSPQAFSLTLQSSVNLNPENNSPDSGNADFGNTLEVIGIDLRDNDTGTLLTSDSVTGSSGSSYKIMAVPEPSSFLLLAGVAGVALAVNRFRFHASLR